MGAASPRIRADIATTRKRTSNVRPLAAAAAGPMHRVDLSATATEVAPSRSQPILSRSIGKGAAKRLFDIVASFGLLMMASPMIVLIAIAIKLEDNGPLFFMSQRVGRHGRSFLMPKFRSMAVSAPTCTRETFTDADGYITAVGKFMRRTGLDELPQLVSVLRGDMSLIGPRPLLIDDPASRERTKFPMALDVRPGISGLAQVSGRNLVSPRRKARLDAFYARTASLGFDCVLLVKTVAVVFTGKGFV